MESPSGGDSRRELIDAVLGAAGWESEAVEVEGQRGPVSTRWYGNERTTLRVVPIDAITLTLLVGRRLPLVIRFATSSPVDPDRLDDVLRLLVEWQDRLGDLDADAAFWNALIASVVFVVVLRDGKPWTIDWSRVDDTGAAQAGYLLSCACQQLGADPERADKMLLRVITKLVHESWSEFFCVCERCGRRWHVESDPGYHYTTYQWTDVTSVGKHAGRFVEPIFEPEPSASASEATPPLAVSKAKDEPKPKDLLQLSPPGEPIAEGLMAPVARGGSMEAPTGLRLRVAWERPLDFEPHTLGLSADGAIAVAAEPGNIEVWEARTGASVGSFQAKGGGLDHLVVSGDGRVIVSWGGMGSKRPTVWRATKRGFRGTRPNMGFSAEVEDIAFHPDGVRALAADGGGLLALFDLASGKVERTWDSGRYAPKIVRFDPLANSVLIAKNDRLTEWDLDSTRVRRSVALDLQNGNNSLVALPPDGRRVAIATEQTDESPCVIVDLEKFEVVGRSEPRPHLAGVQFDRDGERLLVLTDRGRVLETRASDGLRLLSTFTAVTTEDYKNGVSGYGGLRPLPDGDHVAAVLSDDQGHSVVVFAVGSGERIARWRPSVWTGYSPHTKLAVGQTGEVLASSLVKPLSEERIQTERSIEHHVALFAWRD